MSDQWITDVNFGPIAEEHEQIKGRLEVRRPLGLWVLDKRYPEAGFLEDDDPATRLRAWADDYEFRSKPITLEEIRAFFVAHPDLEQTLTIDIHTPIPTVVHYLSVHSQIADLTEPLSRGSQGPPTPVARTGLSDVYRMTLTDSTQVAVKCLRQHDPKHVKRTARELSIWSKLTHRNVLELQGLAVFQGCLAMVSPWMAYGSVSSVLRRWPDIRRFPLCLQLAHAVEFLHGEDVVHGDIKGDNLVMDNDGVIKLMDFGLAIMNEAVFRFSQTDPGGGTSRWMAPELYGDDPQRSKETDVYAMGMTMLEIITGDVPFREIKAGHAVGMAVAHHRRIPRVPELEAETASGQDLVVHGLLKWCWKYDPKERPTAGKVVSVLGPLVET